MFRCTISFALVMIRVLTAFLLSVIKDASAAEATMPRMAIPIAISTMVMPRSGKSGVGFYSSDKERSELFGSVLQFSNPHARIMVSIKCLRLA